MNKVSLSENSSVLQEPVRRYTEEILSAIPSPQRTSLHRDFRMFLRVLWGLCLVAVDLSGVFGEPPPPLNPPATSDEEQRLLGQFCVAIESKNEGTAAEKRSFWRLQLDSFLPQLTSDEGKATLYRLHADHSNNQGDPHEAIRSYKTLVENYAHTKEYKNGLRELLDLAERNNDYATMLAASVASAQGATDESQKVRAVTKEAIAFVGLKEYEKAAELMRGLSANDPTIGERILQAKNNVGVRLIAEQQLDLAQELLTAAYSETKLENRNTPLLANLATVATLRGQKELSLKYHQEAKGLLDPKDDRIPGYDFSIANALFELGRAEEAASHYQAVLNSTSSRKDLAHLKKLSAENLENLRAKDSIADNSTGFDISKRRPTTRMTIVILNAIVVGVIAAAAFIRRRSAKAGNSA